MEVIKRTLKSKSALDCIAVIEKLTNQQKMNKMMPSLISQCVDRFFSPDDKRLYITLNIYDIIIILNFSY